MNGSDQAELASKFVQDVTSAASRKIFADEGFTEPSQPTRGLAKRSRGGPRHLRPASKSHVYRGIHWLRNQKPHPLPLPVAHRGHLLTHPVERLVVTPALIDAAAVPIDRAGAVVVAMVIAARSTRMVASPLVSVRGADADAK